MKVSVLGPPGSYTEKAADELFSRLERAAPLEYVYQSGIESVVSDLFGEESKRSEFAVIPIENSIEGAVGISMDLLLEKNVSVLAEIIIPVNHCLLVSKNAAANPDFSLNRISAVYSHPQGLYQCRSFIRDKLVSARPVETGSTSQAAQIIFESGDENIAAIASAEAADKYGLYKAECHIQDNPNNSTRFFLLVRSDFILPPKELLVSVLTSDHLAQTGSGDVYKKTSIVVTPNQDKPGALFHILEAFYKYGINLTRIESRPSKRVLGEYHFYIDFEGKSGDLDVRDALNRIAEQSARLKILGTYGRISAGL